MTSLTNNVLFDLFTSTYDNGLLNNKVLETSIITGVEGSYMNKGFSKEPDTQGVRERDRGSPDQITTRNFFLADGLIESGLYLRITHDMDPDSHSWSARTTPTQYKVDYVAQTFAVGREKVLSLSSQGHT